MGSVTFLTDIAGDHNGSDHLCKTGPKVMVNGDTIFNVVGDIQIVGLVSECYIDNGATASTLQYSVTTARSQTQTISGASASLANAIAGTTVSIDGSALSTAPNLSVSGVGLDQTARGIRCPTGAIKVVVGVGSTTGTWKHYIRYEPLEYGAYVTAAQ